MGQMLNKDVVPSLQSRGGRNIKKMMPKATKVGTDGVVSPRNMFGNDHPEAVKKLDGPGKRTSNENRKLISD